MKTIMQRGLILAAAIAAFAFVGSTNASAYDHYNHNGYNHNGYNHHGYYNSYNGGRSYYHHNGYWGYNHGTRVWIVL